MNQEFVKIVVECLNEVSRSDGWPIDTEVNRDTVLFGPGGVLDSMGLVNLVILVEQQVTDKHGANITLADVRALSQSRSPFRSVGSLADYAEALTKEVC